MAPTRTQQGNCCNPIRHDISMCRLPRTRNRPGPNIQFTRWFSNWVVHSTLLGKKCAEWGEKKPFAVNISVVCCFMRCIAWIILFSWQPLLNPHILASNGLKGRRIHHRVGEAWTRSGWIQIQDKQRKKILYQPKVQQYQMQMHSQHHSAQSPLVSRGNY